MLRVIVQALSDRRGHFRHVNLLAFPCSLSKYTAHGTYFQELEQELKPQSSYHALRDVACGGLKPSMSSAQEGFPTNLQSPCGARPVVMRKGSSKGLSFPDSHTERLSSIVDFA